MENSRVYVLNQGGHDVSKARKYGQLISVTKGKVNVFATDRLMQEMRDKLKDFNSECDYLLICGSIVLSALTVKVLYEKFENFNILIYNCKSLEYIVRRI